MFSDSSRSAVGRGGELGLARAKGLGGASLGNLAGRRSFLYGHPRTRERKGPDGVVWESGDGRAYGSRRHQEKSCHCAFGTWAIGGAGVTTVSPRPSSNPHARPNRSCARHVSLSTTTTASSTSHCCCSTAIAHPGTIFRDGIRLPARGRRNLFESGRVRK